MQRFLLIGFFAAFFAADASAKRLCDVERISKGQNDEEINVIFSGSVDKEITREEDGSPSFHSQKEGVLKSNGKNVDELALKRGKRLFASHGSSKSCVIYPGERDEKFGAYIEEQTFKPGQPPQIKSEFVEID